MAETKINSAGEQQPVDGQSRYAKMSASELSEELAQEAPPKVTSFANKERKYTNHHKHHAQEMGYRNQDEYEKAAIEFFNGNVGELYVSPQGDWYRYDDRTRIVAVCDKDGIMRTFFDFKTKHGFEKQVKQRGLKKC